jgi:DNA-binding PadR family transcriptional regulator
MEYRTQRATEARRERGAETDYDLYEMISDHPGSSGYELAKLMGWTTGRTRSAIDRLERKGLIKVERAVRAGRSVLSVAPKPWQEFLTPEELEEFRQTDLNSSFATSSKMRIEKGSVCQSICFYLRLKFPK